MFTIQTLKSNVNSKFFDLHELMVIMTLRISSYKNNEIIAKMEKSYEHDSIPCENEELDLGITLRGGQSFRWAACGEENIYRGVFSSTVWTLRQKDNKLMYTMHGTLQDDLKCKELLSNYFHLNLSLKKNLKEWANSDSHFETSYDKIGAVRILNQDIIENLFSFICSSNNNIIRISGMVEKLCRIFGKKICTVEDQEFYDFPTIEALAKPEVENILRKEGFGYRAGYISKSAEKLLTLGGKEWLLNLKKENGTTYEYARESLMSLPGVGPKVADCICLMSLSHLEAIPVDTHIFQVACSNYTPHLSKQKTVTPKIHQEVSSYLRELWGPLAGWAQAIVFCMKINSTDNRKNKKRSISPDKKSTAKTKNSKNKVSI